MVMVHCKVKTFKQMHSGITVISTVVPGAFWRKPYAAFKGLVVDSVHATSLTSVFCNM